MTSTTLDTDRSLVARSVSKRFGATRALDDVDIVVVPGRVHALVGENGAGKSTLAKILAGIEHADTGAMMVAGAAYAPRDRADAKARGVNMVPQQLSLVGELTLVENLLLTGSARLARRARARTLLRETMDRAGVAVDIDIPTARLSQAHRQLGEIVVALAEGATTLILDEPTASLGPVEVGGLFDHLRQLCALGTAIVLITHRLEEVREVADDVTVLSHGADVHTGDARGLEPREIARLMVGELPPAAVRTPSVPGAAVLELRGVRAHSTSGDSSLDGVDLAVRAGELVGLAGVAGSGQNLLIDVLAGMTAPDAGDVVVAGHVAPTAAQVLGAGVAWIPEERSEALAPDMSLGETLGVYESAKGGRRVSIRRSAATQPASVLTAFDVRPAEPALLASGLSGGNQQKLLTARELGGAAAPTAVLAYGPTQGLDLRASQAIRERLRGLADGGAAVLVASHDLEELLEIADRIVVLFGGRIVADVDRSDATTERLGAAMAGIPAPASAPPASTTPPASPTTAPQEPLA